MGRACFVGQTHVRRALAGRDNIHRRGGGRRLGQRRVAGALHARQKRAGFLDDERGGDQIAGAPAVEQARVADPEGHRHPRHEPADIVMLDGDQLPASIHGQDLTAQLVLALGPRAATGGQREDDDSRKGLTHRCHSSSALNGRKAATDEFCGLRGRGMQSAILPADESAPLALATRVSFPAGAVQDAGTRLTRQMRVIFAAQASRGLARGRSK
jgi:hypothetical protein